MLLELKDLLRATKQRESFVLSQTDIDPKPISLYKEPPALNKLQLSSEFASLEV